MKTMSQAWTALLILLSPPIGAAENTLRNLSSGIVYPSGSTAVMENPALLSISQGDQIELFYGLPYATGKTVDKKTGKSKDTIKYQKPEKPSPVWLTYGGSPSPFGIGYALVVNKQDPIVYSALSFGIEKFQLGYMLRIEPAIDKLFHNYAFRVGGVEGLAASIVWGDQKTILGIGYSMDYFHAEVDQRIDLEFENDPILSGAIGILSPYFGFNVGYTAESLKRPTPSTSGIHAAINAMFAENFGLNLYYKRLFNEFVVSMVVKF